MDQTARMSDESKKNPAIDEAFGRMLKFWRATFEISQEELSDRVGVSARHISFLENNRSHPGRNLVVKIADVFELKLRDASNLLAAAGYMPDTFSIDEDDPNMRWLRKSLIMALKNHDPHPSMILDRYGNVLMVNRAWVHSFGSVLGAVIYELPLNTNRLYLSEKGWQPYLEDWEDVACGMLMTLQEEILMHPDAKAEALLSELKTYPGVPDDWAKRAAKFDRPNSFFTRLRFPSGELRTTMTVLHAAGNSSYATEPRLVIDTGYPVDFEPELSAEELAAADIKHPLLFY